MAEQNFNEQGVNSQVGNIDTDNVISLQDLMDVIVRKWYWFVISVLVCLALGTLYILKTSLVYNRTATIMVKDSRKGSGMMEMAAFNDILGSSTKRNVDNELFVLQARRLMIDVVQRLNLTTSYTTRQGLRTIDLYKRSPINVTFVNDNGTSRCSFRAKLLENKVEISKFLCPKQDNRGGNDDDDFEVTASYGEPITTPVGEIIIEPTLYMDSEYVGKTINVSKSTKELVAAYYRSATKSDVANKLSSIITISLNDVVAKRAEDIINTLIEVYNDDAVYDKQQISEATADFINDRLRIISKELGSADNDIKAFKSRNRMVDIETETKRNISESSQYKSEGLSVESQIEMAKFIKEYLNDSNKEYNLIPTANFGEGTTSTMLSKQISEYNELILRREKLSQNGATNNPVIQQIDRDRVAMKNAILSSIDSNIETLKIKLDNLRHEENKTNLRISSVPSQEQEYLSIARQQRIKEELYLYLLNKREENAISLAVTESSARVIDSAFGSMLPIKPKKSFVLMMMFAIGLIIPATIIYICEMFDTRVRGRRDIERAISVPYLGDIPLYTGIPAQRGIAVKENGRDNISEAFRIIRTNMGFMNTFEGKQQVIQVTSSNAHAGKTFVSSNLGMTYAFSGNKVLMIDLDLRRRTLSKHMGQRNNPNGITRFISDKNTTVNDIIMKSELHENFDFIYAGLQPPNPAEMLLSERLTELIGTCRKMYDYIIIDSVPVMVIADALITSRISDITMYIVREGLLDRRQLPDIDALYREKKLHNMCLVLNGASEHNHRYGYGYGYTYNSDGDELKESLFRRFLNKIGIGTLLKRRSAKRDIF